MTTTNLPDEMQPKPADRGQGMEPLWVGLAIFFFFPAGLYLLWKHPVLGRNKAWWWAGGIWGVLVLMAAMNRDKDGAKDLASGGPAIAQASPEPATANAEVAALPQAEGAQAVEEKETKTYKISKGFGRGSVTIELPTDYDVGLDFSDFEYEDYFLQFTAFWHSARSKKPMRHWEAIDSKGAVIDSGNLFFASIRSYTPTRGRISLPPDTWKKTDKIMIQ